MASDKTVKENLDKIKSVKLYNEDEVETLIKAFYLDSNQGDLKKMDMEWCKKWIKENLYK